MKLQKLLLSALVLVSLSAYSQEETEQERECKRMRFLAGEDLKIKNYAGASAYYIKGEAICGNYDKANYDRMIGSIRNTISGETDKVRKSAYIDTIIGVYDRAEQKGFYDQANDLIRASYIVQSTKPNRAAADVLFARGIAKVGAAPSETQLNLYYSNLYVLYTESTDAAKKTELKKRLISDYFSLSKMVSDLKMSAKTQENITTYFNNIVRSCEDILPDLKGFLATLPQDKEMKKKAVVNFMTLLETKKCTDAKEYEMLVDTLNAIDPSLDGKLAKARLLVSKKRYSEAVAAFKEAKTMTTESAKIEEIEYMIASTQFNSGSYNAAYSTAMGISGENRAEALYLAAQCVAKLANGCGSSTIERKANYLYAARLADQAGQGGAAAKYRAAGPTDGEWFDAGINSITLSCWNVTVSK
ncbi:MAG: hypothetical protein ACK49D_12030 [Flavobacteriia bacterium]|nr:hypothetical protein [Cryomorphaceae bacterium]